MDPYALLPCRASARDWRHTIIWQVAIAAEIAKIVTAAMVAATQRFQGPPVGVGGPSFKPSGVNHHQILRTMSLAGIADPLPAKYHSQFSTLFHLTSIDAAIGILSTGVIWGRDNDKQANFSVIQERLDLARYTEVSLQFHWPGSHAVLFGNPIGNGEPSCPALTQPILYHVFSPDDWHPGEDLLSKRYWFSGLYPGSTGLVFQGIRRWLAQRPNDPSPPPRWPWWSYQRRRRHYSDVMTDHARFDRLAQLAKTSFGQQLSVP